MKLPHREEEAACAAAEGLRDNDAPVKSILLTKAGDGYMPSGGNYQSLFYAYMLHIVTAARRALHGKVSYYPDAGTPLLAGDMGGGGSDKGGAGGDGSAGSGDSAAPGADASGGGAGDDGCSCEMRGGRDAGQAGAAAISLLLLVLVRRKRRGRIC